VSTQAVGFAGVLDRMVRDAGIEDFAPRSVGPALSARPAAPAPAPVIEPGAPVPVEPAAAEERFEALVPAVVNRVAPLHADPVPLTVPATPAPLDAALVPASLETPPEVDQRWLARIGVPTNVAVHLPEMTTDPAVAIYHLMDQLAVPDALPTGQGSIIAVVGRRADALEMAEAFAEELGTSPDEILVAAASFRGTSVPEDRRLSSVDLAMERRRSWRRRNRPTIIAVDSSMGRQRNAWATHLLDAVEPTMVWGVVEATRKAEDIRDWAEHLGGLDALAVIDLDETVSPAAVLGAGVPVGRLDGYAATASRWTAILTEHLEIAA
jgi:hypothetical protein